MFSERSWTQKATFNVHEMSRTGKSIETEKKQVPQGAGDGEGRGGETRGDYVTGTMRVSFGGDENALKLDGGDACTTL